MHPDITLQLAADRIREMRAQADDERLARRARKGRVRALLSR
jgi:hypothetical protein